MRPVAIVIGYIVVLWLAAAFVYTSDGDLVGWLILGGVVLWTVRAWQNRHPV